MKTNLLRYSFPNKVRLRSRKDFKEIFEKGVFIRGKFVKIGVLKNAFNFNRFGVCVSKDISKKSTGRNKLKRMLREIFRLNREKIKDGFDIVAVIKFNPALKRETDSVSIFKYDAIKSEVLKLLSNVKCLK